MSPRRVPRVDRGLSMNAHKEVKRSIKMHVMVAMMDQSRHWMS